MGVWRGAQFCSENKPKELVVAGVWHNNESARARQWSWSKDPYPRVPVKCWTSPTPRVPLAAKRKSFEDFWESLNQFKEEEGSSGEVCVQRSGVEAPRAPPPPPIPKALGKEPQRAKQFVKAGQAEAQEAKPKAKQASTPQFQPSGVQSKKRKKVPSPDDSGDESSPILTDESEDSEDPPLKPPPTEKSKVKQKSKKPLKKTKEGDGAPKETESVSAAEKVADQPLEEEAPAPQDKGPTPQDEEVSQKVCC